MNKFNPLLHGLGRKPMMGGGDSGGGTSTTTQEIPVELKPLATEYTTQAIDLSQQEYDPYTGERYAELTDPQLSGIDMITGRALGGSATNSAAEGALNSFYNQGPNPYLDQMYNQAAGQMSDSINSNFSSSGRYGSGAQNEVLGQSLGNLATNMYGGAYAQDQANKLQAIGMAPTFGNLAYGDASQLLNAGQILQDEAQNPLDFQYQQYQEEQNLPYQQLAAMSGVFGSNLGSSSTTTQSGGGGGK